MKQTLRFISNDQFQSFTSQLFSEELSSFQPIEGSGGDGGLDGVEGDTAYQMYFPEIENRTTKKYINKINTDLNKAQETMAEQKLNIKRWILVVPDDLGKDVVLHLKTKSQETGIECLYWGATKLSALVNKYPYIRDAFPEVFLPDVKEDLGKVKSGVAQLGRRTNAHNVEIITDEEFARQKQAILAKHARQAHSFQIRFSGSSAAQAASHAVKIEADQEIADLVAKKKNSDRFYELEQQDVRDVFDKEYQDKQNDLGRRNRLTSGFGQQELSEITERRTRELEKLALKYGKPKGS